MASTVIINKFLKACHITRSIGRQPGSERPLKITAEIKEIVEMRIDNETMAYQFHQLLIEKGYSILLCNILRCITALDGHSEEAYIAN